MSSHQDSPKVPGWPPLLIAGIQVGNPEKVGDNRLFGVIHKAKSAMDRYRADEIETYIPVSALLSDEVVGAAAHGNYEAGRVEIHGPSHPEWDDALEQIKEIDRKHARRVLQAAIEQVGGAE